MKNQINSGLRVICIFACLLIAVSSAIAQAYEPFNYPVGSAPGNGGTGWAAPWTPNGTVLVAPGLTFTGLSASGNVLGGTPGSAATRLLQTPVVGAAGTSVILQALFKSPVNGTPATQATLGNSPGGLGNNFIIGDLPQADANANKWGLQNDCGRFYSNKLVVANQTAYLIAQIDFDVSGTNDRMRLWVQTTGPAVPYSTLSSNVTPDVDVLCNVNTFGGVFWQTQQGQVVDEIRVDKVLALQESSELNVSLGSDGRLTVRGTPGVDDVLLRLDPTGKKIEVDNLTNRNGTDYNFELALVRSIHIFLAGGDDRVIFDDTNGSLGILRPLEVDVGEGDNTVIGSTGALKPNEIADLGNTIAQLKKVLEGAARLRDRAEKLTRSAGELAATDGVAFTQTADRFSTDAQKQFIDSAEALRKDADNQIVAVADQFIRETPSVFFQQPETRGSLLDPFADREANAFVQRLDRLVAEAAKVADDDRKVGPLVDRMESEIDSLNLAADKLEVRLQKGPSQAELSPERRALQLEQAGDAFLARADKELLGSGDTFLVRADQDLLGGGNAFSGRADAIAREADAIAREADELNEAILPVVGRLFEGTAAAKTKVQATTQQAGCTFTTTNTISGSGLLIGTAGNDLMIGLATNDVMIGLGGNDRMRGGAGNDLMFGNSGDDDMYGEAGTDFMFGNDGDDCMSGGDGVDLMFGNQGKDFMHGNDGPTVTFTVSGATVSIKLGDVIFGNGDDDQMYGDEGLDLMFGNAGKDTMHGNDGADFMFGNQDADTMYGEAGKGITITIGTNPPVTPPIGNFMFGNAEKDQMWGGVDRDFMWGNDDNDTMNGDADMDFMFGNQGDDTINGNDGTDFIFGNQGNDTINGNDGTDFIFGNQGDDTMHGNGGIDFMWGNEDNDTMHGDLGIDFMWGNRGNDTMNGDDGIDFMWGNEDNDTMHGDNGIDFMWGNRGNDTMNGDDGIDFMWGNEDNDTMNGNVGIDFMWGNSGNDTMHGNDGIDFMWGNEDDDTMNGDVGSDFMWGNEGNDTMHGDDGVDFMQGNQGDDTMYGDAGSDFMWGNEGNDTMNGNDAADFMFGGDDDDLMDGGLGNDLMLGNAGDDCMDGSAGNDFMLGNQGKDRMFGGPGIDVMFGNDGNDCMDGGDDRDFMFGNQGDDNMLGDNGNDVMWGNQGDDLMDGGAGNDFIWGNQGNDNMFGGPGIDIIWGGLGSDTTSQNGSSGVTCAPCIPPKCDLKIEKKVPTLVKGQQATATITVTNVGGALCSGPTTVTETVPAGLTLVSASGPGWVCSGAVCTYANPIPVNGSVSVTYTFNVTAQPGTAIQNCAAVSNKNDNNPANNQSCVTTPVMVAGCDREIKKTVTPNPVQSGQQVTTTLTVTNVGTAPCPVVGGINLADSQPSGWSFQLPVSANKPGWSCGFTGPGVSAYCTSTSPLLPGAANAVSITFTGKITAPAGSTIQNCAGVTNVGDVNQANNNSCVNVTVH